MPWSPRWSVRLGLLLLLSWSVGSESAQDMRTRRALASDLMPRLPPLSHSLIVEDVAGSLFRLDWLDEKLIWAAKTAQPTPIESDPATFTHPATQLQNSLISFADFSHPHNEPLLTARLISTLSGQLVYIDYTGEIIPLKMHVDEVLLQSPFKTPLFPETLLIGQQRRGVNTLNFDRGTAVRVGCDTPFLQAGNLCQNMCAIRDADTRHLEIASVLTSIGAINSTTHKPRWKLELTQILSVGEPPIVEESEAECDLFSRDFSSGLDGDALQLWRSTEDQRRRSRCDELRVARALSESVSTSGRTLSIDFCGLVRVAASDEPPMAAWKAACTNNSIVSRFTFLLPILHVFPLKRLDDHSMLTLGSSVASPPTSLKMVPPDLQHALHQHLLSRVASSQDGAEWRTDLDEANSVEQKTLLINSLLTSAKAAPRDTNLLERSLYLPLHNDRHPELRRGGRKTLTYSTNSPAGDGEIYVAILSPPRRNARSFGAISIILSLPSLLLIGLGWYMHGTMQRPFGAQSAAAIEDALPLLTEPRPPKVASPRAFRWPNLKLKFSRRSAPDDSPKERSHDRSQRKGAQRIVNLVRHLGTRVGKPSPERMPKEKTSAREKETTLNQDETACEEKESAHEDKETEYEDKKTPNKDQEAANKDRETARNERETADKDRETEGKEAAGLKETAGKDVGGDVLIIPEGSRLSNLIENGRLERTFTNWRLIGQGGFGAVYRAEHKLEPRRSIYALKLVELQATLNGECKGLREVTTNRHLLSKYVVRYFTWWCEEPRFLPMPTTTPNAATVKPLRERRQTETQSIFQSRRALDRATVGSDEQIPRSLLLDNSKLVRDMENDLLLGVGSDSGTTSGDGETRPPVTLAEETRDNILFVNTERQESSVEASRPQERDRDGSDETSTKKKTTKELSVPVTLVIQMEWCSGMTLRQWLDRGERRESCLMVGGDGGEECVRVELILFKQLMKGLRDIHTHGIVHRDLKPDNIFIDPETSGLKIGDFGLSKILQTEKEDEDRDAALSQKGLLIGTPGYTAPEGGAGCSEKADIFSSSLILLELLAHKPNTVHERHRMLAAFREYSKFPEYFDNEQYGGWKLLLVAMASIRPEDRPSAELILQILKQSACAHSCHGYELSPRAVKECLMAQSSTSTVESRCTLGGPRVSSPGETVLTL